MKNILLIILLIILSSCDNNVVELTPTPTSTNETIDYGKIYDNYSFKDNFSFDEININDIISIKISYCFVNEEDRADINTLKVKEGYFKDLINSLKGVTFTSDYNNKIAIKLNHDIEPLDNRHFNFLPLQLIIEYEDEIHTLYTKHFLYESTGGYTYRFKYSVNYKDSYQIFNKTYYADSDPLYDKFFDILNSYTDYYYGDIVFYLN